MLLRSHLVTNELLPLFLQHVHALESRGLGLRRGSAGGTGEVRRIWMSLAQHVGKRSLGLRQVVPLFKPRSTWNWWQRLLAVERLLLLLLRVPILMWVLRI